MKHYIAALLLSSIVTIHAATVVVTDASIQAGQQVSWTADNEYVLSGHVWVESGAKLTIQPGTIIRGREGQGANASALIICTGAQIFAQGTRAKPIIFTAEMDDFLPMGEGVMEKTSSSLWGGVILLGRAPISGGGTSFFEALDQTDPRNTYGGNDSADNSGVLQYVSIRFGGKMFLAQKEINGLTMCGVGAGTTIEYVEIFNNYDDGFEWFGGTVNTRYLLVVGAGDDAFDYDQGYRGKGQFWCAVHNRPSDGGYCGEFSGGQGNPRSHLVASNITFCATLYGFNPPVTFQFDSYASAVIANSIFFNTGYIPLLSGSELQYHNGNLKILNNVFWQSGMTPPYLWSKICASPDLSSPSCDILISGNNTIKDPLFVGSNFNLPGNRTSDLRPRDPVALTKIVPDSVLDPTGYIKPVCFKGAFDPTVSDLWIKGWTAYDFYGYCTNNLAAPVPSCSSTAVLGFNSESAHRQGEIAVVTRGNFLRVNASAGMVEIFSAAGKRVAALSAGALVPTAGLTPGAYTVRVTTTGGYPQASRIVVR